MSIAHSRSRRLLPGVILGWAAVLRFAGLGTNPPGLWYDEASTGYDAFCILHAGTDRFGDSFPLFFRGFGDYISGLYHYLSIPFIAVLGLTPFAVRLPSAILSLLTVWLTFAAVRRWWDDDRAALLAAAFVAISPWVLPYARSGHRVMLLPFFLALFLAFAARAETAERPRGWSLLAGSSLGLAMYGYASGEVLAPILFFGYAALLRRRSPEALRYAALGFAVIALPFVGYAAVHPEIIFARLAETSGREGLVPASVFLHNLLLHYDPRFLFISGDANLRHSLPGYGELHWLEAPLLIAGVLVALRRRSRLDLLLLLALATFAVPAAITRFDIPHGLRSIGVVPFVHILSATGAVAILDVLRDRRERAALAAFQVALSVGLVLTAAVFSYQVLVHYPSVSGPEWRAGTPDAIAAVLPEARRGRTVIWYTRFVNLDPVEFLFFARVPPGSPLTKLGDLRFYPPSPADLADPRNVVVLDPWAVRRLGTTRAPDRTLANGDGTAALYLYGLSDLAPGGVVTPPR
jgi:4-amino-4-deoxy-L-arabinose transferase-like glycosyltransferase